MMIALASLPSTPSASNDDDSELSHSQLSPPSYVAPLTFEQAVFLARKMRDDLRPHTRDRKWHFKSYSNCFKASHAVSWALDNISCDEQVAVNKLNQLICHGLLYHVVDHSKRFRVGESRTLYFRMSPDDILEVDVTARGSPTKVIPLARGEFGVAGNYGSSLESMQQQLSNMDHILQETVKELNDTRGKLEMVQQEVLGLVSQQIATFLMLFLMFFYMIFFLVPWSGAGWVSAVAFVVTAIVFTSHGYRCISLWSDLDSRAGPMETITVTDDGSNSLTGGSVRHLKTYEKKATSTSITSIVSKSIKTMAGVSGKEIRRSSSSHGKEKERPVFMREEYTLPDVKTWPHRPLLICANSRACPDLVTDHSLGPVPLGVPFEFESDLFKGKCLIRLRGSQSDNTTGDAEYFMGRKRIFQSIVQGQFKEEISVSDVLSGHEFVRPLKNLPHPFILKTATNFIGKVSPGANIVVHNDQPFVEAILGGTSQVVRGDEPGNEPNITCRNIIEDCSVFGGIFAEGDDVSVSRRKRLFSNPAKCQNYTYDTETVYTFEFYQNLFDAQSYALDLGFTKINISRILNGQPIQWLGKLKDGRYLWSFQIWHEKLLQNGSNK